jgi:hypothetical protein
MENSFWNGTVQHRPNGSDVMEPGFSDTAVNAGETASKLVGISKGCGSAGLRFSGRQHGCVCKVKGRTIMPRKRSVARMLLHARGAAFGLKGGDKGLPSEERPTTAEGSAADHAA